MGAARILYKTIEVELCTQVILVIVVYARQLRWDLVFVY